MPYRASGLTLGGVARRPAVPPIPPPPSHPTQTAQATTTDGDSLRGRAAAPGRCPCAPYPNSRFEPSHSALRWVPTQAVGAIALLRFLLWGHPRPQPPVLALPALAPVPQKRCFVWGFHPCTGIDSISARLSAWSKSLWAFIPLPKSKSFSNPRRATGAS